MSWWEEEEEEVEEEEEEEEAAEEAAAAVAVAVPVRVWVPRRTREMWSSSRWSSGGWRCFGYTRAPSTCTPAAPTWCDTAPSYTVTGSVTYGYRIWHMRLQALAHMVYLHVGCQARPRANPNPNLTQTPTLT